MEDVGVGGGGRYRYAVGCKYVRFYMDRSISLSVSLFA